MSQKTEEQEIKEAMHKLAKLDVLREQWYQAESELKRRPAWAVKRQMELEESMISIILEKAK